MNGAAAPVALRLRQHHRKERGDEAETREAVASVEGDGMVRGDGSGSRRSSNSGECGRWLQTARRRLGFERRDAGERGVSGRRLYRRRGGTVAWGRGGR